MQLWNSDEVDLEISNSFIELGQRGKMLLSIFRDVSERKRAELRIEAFSNLGQRLSATQTAREAAGIITEVAGELLGWDACSFSLLSPARDLLDHVLNVDTIDGRRVESSVGYEPPSALARHTLETERTPTVRLSTRTGTHMIDAESRDASPNRMVSVA